MTSATVLEAEVADALRDECRKHFNNSCWSVDVSLDFAKRAVEVVLRGSARGEASEGPATTAKATQAKPTREERIAEAKERVVEAAKAWNGGRPGAACATVPALASAVDALDAAEKPELPNAAEKPELPKLLTPDERADHHSVWRSPGRDMVKEVVQVDRADIMAKIRLLPAFPVREAKCMSDPLARSVRLCDLEYLLAGQP